MLKLFTLFSLEVVPGLHELDETARLSFISLLPICLANSLEMQMVDFRLDPLKSSAYAITEMVTMKFQEGSNKQQMDTVLHRFMDLRPKMSKELDLTEDLFCVGRDGRCALHILLLFGWG
jgi:hypothetical protein